VNGHAGALDRYDFHAPHAIGGEDHADGEVFRYALGELLRVPEVPSHVVYDAQRKLVYVADTGHARVLSIDPASATLGGAIDVYEDLVGSGEMVGATVVELVPPGTLQAPSGLALAGNVLYVTDNATSRIHAFDIDGKPLAALDTQLPTGTLAGIAVGPDSLLYFTDLLSGAVRRVAPL
jgi:DNA-binding beta-propeller fold protein YncE